MENNLTKLGDEILAQAEVVECEGEFTDEGMLRGWLKRLRRAAQEGCERCKYKANCGDKEVAEQCLSCIYALMIRGEAANNFKPLDSFTDNQEGDTDGH